MKEVKILHRNESRVVIEGIDEGTEIALVDPTRTPASSTAPAATPTAPRPPAGGGR